MRDERSFRVALVADRYVNPAPGGLDGLAVLAAACWGVMQLPDDAYPAEVAGLLLAEIAEQVEEFSRHGYLFVLVGGRDGLDEALASSASSSPPSRTRRRSPPLRTPPGEGRPCAPTLVPRRLPNGRLRVGLQAGGSGRAWAGQDGRLLPDVVMQDSGGRGRGPVPLVRQWWWRRSGNSCRTRRKDIAFGGC